MHNIPFIFNLQLMKLDIVINFEDTYEIESISEDLSKFQFTSYDKNDSPVLLTVLIEKNKNPFLPTVFNLAFGPHNENGEMDDKAIVKHRNSSRVFSTILLGALTFLNSNKESFIGIDGSNLVRACLYYKMMQINHDYLCQFFNLIGVKYYTRLLKGVNADDTLFIDYRRSGNPAFQNYQISEY